MAPVLRPGVSLFQNRDRQDEDQHPHCRHRPEQALPRELQHDQVTHYRRQHRDNAGDAVHHGEHFGATLGA